MHKEKPKIVCPTFRKQNSVIKNIIDKIDKVQGVQDNTEFFGRVQKEADMPLSCPQYKSESI